jgi:hypothetical protein
MTQLQNYNKCLILNVIKTLFRYRAVSTTSDLGLVSGGIDNQVIDNRPSLVILS